MIKKSSAGSGVFWDAASVFSKKWLDWRHKQKKIHHGKRPAQKPVHRHYRETQSEVADYGHERNSFDDARFFFDGHLIGKSFPKMGAAAAIVGVFVVAAA